MVDADKQPGGLAGSFKTPEGFRFDHGYMIIPTRYEFIKKLLEELGPGDDKKAKEFIEFVQKTRNNFVYIRNGCQNISKVSFVHSNKRIEIGHNR